MQGLLAQAGGSSFAQPATLSRPDIKPSVIARSVSDEAIQSCFAASWIASLALAMTQVYSAGPANNSRLPSGSLTMKLRAPQGCRLSVWKNVTPAA